ncbi:LysR family transcriptional regulator [Herbaspirillum seropedicae]|uniref:Transcription regulator protein n=1 Tax=Herbaspirillum seropedicae (strain SmR1) TaxID=757424 RepID=D8IS28_HERSS|nr:LysR family transcriptional regulator [Herbaspirillum seropedicae]ADJ65371.1 transcription regulator protein [Herbaspirillum seropedicae SmR1]AKN67215.1 LysR family transcriptional regulator [Herbaspirillum seropedicae]NQE31795.1 LysR family transcriptional regulator [Herbaspirillum seropedicae]UMU23223.1 LysR family transcriptional regulator [Herbaspirillum seropedicae]
METMTSIECFVAAAHAGSFSAAARQLGLTSAAVGKNVARLESSLGVRLFHRSTRKLSLTEAGERFLQEVGGGLQAIRSAVANLASAGGQPAGTLKVSMGTGFGRQYIVPLLGEFLGRYPGIQPDWHFENRPVDLISEGFDAAIAGGTELSPGVVARELAPAHRVLLASPAYLDAHPPLHSPADLAEHAGILIRSPQTGRVRPFSLRDRSGQQAPVTLQQRMTMSDANAACEVAEAGLGITLVAMPHALPYLEGGTLVRVLPDWYVDTGMLSLYFTAARLLPAKTRVFVDFVVEHFRRERLAERFSAQR